MVPVLPAGQPGPHQERHQRFLWSIGPHDVSIANYLIGRLPAASARGARYLHVDVEDVVFATLGYDGGVLAHLHVSWLDPSKLRRTTVVGSRGGWSSTTSNSEAKLRVYDKGADPVWAARRVPVPPAPRRPHSPAPT